VLDLIAETGANQDRIKGAHFDLTKPAAPAALVSFASSHFGGIDVVVNNAGMTSVSQSSASESGALCGVSRESWRLSMARNVETAVFVTQAALPHLQKSSAGRVIVISSITGPVMCAAKQFLSSLLLQTKKSKSSRKQSGRCRMRWHMQLPKLDSAVLFAHLLWILGRQVQLFT
jgi:NAD(P)-dependent dehydrogenase (short-subunit alcohol dehydrogenase family)